MNRFFKPILLGIVIVCIIVVGRYLVQDKTTREKSGFIVKNQATPSPFPFHELTIPYLGSRTYEGTFLNIQETGRNSIYSTYRASYLSDGLTIYGQLTLPNTSTPENEFPAVIFIHGYIPPAQYRTEINYASYVDYFARNGFVVFKIDLRGHDRSEGRPTGAYYSSDYIIDVLNAYYALQTAKEVKVGKIGLWGHSMAGNVVLRAVSAKKDIPAVVIWAGAVYTYSDMRNFGIQDNSYRPLPTSSPQASQRQRLRDAYGEFDSNHWFWKQIPATNYLDGVITAIQIHHAQDDNVVNIGYSRELMATLDKTKIPHELFEYPSGGHNMTGVSYTEAMNRSVEFFRNQLQ